MGQQQKEFVKLISTLAYRHSKWRVFQDVCLMGMYSIHNAVSFTQEFEDQYLQIVKRYSKKEACILAQAFGVIVLALEENQEQDFLGQLFMDMELSSHWAGQYFTPWEVARLMARMVVGADAQEIIIEKGGLLIQEPAAGSGVMVIATISCLKQQKVSIYRDVYFETWDIDIVTVAMCYIQLSLLGVTARVVHGDTLSQEVFKVYPTPMYYMYGEALMLRVHKPTKPPTKKHLGKAGKVDPR